MYRKKKSKKQKEHVKHTAKIPAQEKSVEKTAKTDVAYVKHLFFCFLSFVLHVCACLLLLSLSLSLFFLKKIIIIITSYSSLQEEHMGFISFFPFTVSLKKK
jgi:hypothetical protein